MNIRNCSKTFESDILSKQNRVMLDASVRRFKIQQTYLKASAALRWVNSRNAILGGNQPSPIHTPALLQIANTMRAVSFEHFIISSFFCFFCKGRKKLKERSQHMPAEPRDCGNEATHNDLACVSLSSSWLTYLSFFFPGTCIRNARSGRAGPTISRQRPGEMACRGSNIERHGTQHCSEWPMMASS
jgi:hypothetical protein